MYVFLNDKYRDRDRDRRYWPCIYLVSDRYQNLQYRTPLIVTQNLVTSECGAQSWTCMFTCERHTHKRTKTVRKSYLFSRLYLNVESKQDLTVIHTTAFTRYQDMSNSGIFLLTLLKLQKQMTLADWLFLMSEKERVTKQTGELAFWFSLTLLVNR